MMNPVQMGSEDMVSGNVYWMGGVKATRLGEIQLRVDEGGFLTVKGAINVQTISVDKCRTALVYERSIRPH